MTTVPLNAYTVEVSYPVGYFATVRVTAPCPEDACAYALELAREPVTAAEFEADDSVGAFCVSRLLEGDHDDVHDAPIDCELDVPEGFASAALEARAEAHRLLAVVRTAASLPEVAAALARVGVDVHAALAMAEGRPVSTHTEEA
jgi:hypothetical protein